MSVSIKNSIRPNPNGDLPKIAPTAYVDPTAQIIGNVHIGSEVFIGPNTIIRADESDAEGKVRHIRIGAQCNVQDGVIIHALGGTEVTIGQRTSLAHGCIIHGPCAIGTDFFIGFRAMVFNASLGDKVFIITSAVIQGVDLITNAFVPPVVSVVSKEDVIRWVSTTSPDVCKFMEKVVNANLILAKGYVRLRQGQGKSGTNYDKQFKFSQRQDQK